MTGADGAEVPESSPMADWPTGRLLSTAARLVEHRWTEALESQGLTHAGLVVLHLLAGGPLAQKALAAGARVEAQTMSRTVERLEREGYVAREADALDRRRQLVTRTPRGADAWRASQTLEADVFPSLTDSGAVREALLEIIRASSGGRWNHPD